MRTLPYNFSEDIVGYEKLNCVLYDYPMLSSTRSLP